MFVEAESFWELCKSPAHWGFEIMLMVIFDGLLGMFVWPKLRKHWQHHIERDVREGRG